MYTLVLVIVWYHHHCSYVLCYCVNNTHITLQFNASNVTYKVFAGPKFKDTGCCATEVETKNHFIWKKIAEGDSGSGSGRELC